jgi:hypothetical protein
VVATYAAFPKNFDWTGKVQTAFAAASLRCVVPAGIVTEEFWPRTLALLKAVALKYVVVSVFRNGTVCPVPWTYPRRIAVAFVVWMIVCDAA